MALHRLSRSVFALLVILTLAISVACEDDDGTQSAATATLGPAATGTPEPLGYSYETGPCKITLPAGQTPDGVECGRLTVPENRDDPNGRVVHLPVAILKATGPDPAPDPVLYLSGGPGGPSLEGEMQSWTRSFAAPIQERRDIIFFDQRGTGLAEPSLHCPEVSDAFLAGLAQRMTQIEEDAAARAVANECRRRLVADGVDLSAYTSAASAADIRDLRDALGYGEWNIYGVSYGTRLALTVLRDHPAGVRSVVLDSTVPLQADVDVDQAAHFERTLELMYRDCAADAGCAAAYPDLRETVMRLLSDLNELPVTVTPTDADGQPLPIVVTGDRLAAGAFQVFYATNLIPIVPFAAYQIAEGNLGLLTELAGAVASIPLSTARAMNISVNCAEEVPFTTEDDLLAGTDGVDAALLGTSIGVTTPGELSAEQEFCEAWGAVDLPESEDEPVESDVPALVLAGEYDPITPPRYGEMAAETLSNSFFFEFPGTGHGVIYGRNACAAAIVVAWLDDTSAEPDASCIDALGPPQWQLR